MSRSIIDAHIHLDMYEEKDRMRILGELEAYDVKALVAVSNDLVSSCEQLEFASMDSRIKPAIGYHPEQALPSDVELSAILQLIDDNVDRITAIGEVGLPYYLCQQQTDLDVAPYIEILECFIRKAAQHDLPIALHAVYSDAAIVCDLLEKHSISRAHFHWFKGADDILQRILSNGYMISVTPEVVYRPKIQHLVKCIPLTQLMVETDGPWLFEDIFKGKLTHPAMIHESVKSIARIKDDDIGDVYNEIYKTTQNFYRM